MSNMTRRFANLGQGQARVKVGNDYEVVSSSLQTSYHPIKYRSNLSFHIVSTLVTTAQTTGMNLEGEKKTHGKIIKHSMSNDDLPFHETLDFGSDVFKEWCYLSAWPDVE